MIDFKKVGEAALLGHAQEAERFRLANLDHALTDEQWELCGAAAGKAAVAAMIPGLESMQAGLHPDAPTWEECSEDCPFLDHHRGQCNCGWTENEMIPGPNCPASGKGEGK